MGAFASALIALIKYNNYRELLDSVPNDIITRLNPNDLFLRTEVMVWLAMGIAGIAVLFGIVALVGRICDCTETKSINRRICTSLVSEFQ